MHFDKGLLIASPTDPFVVFYAPTHERSLRKKEVDIDHLILHFTACKASERKNADLETLLKRAAFPEPGRKGYQDKIREMIGTNPIPSILSLVLQGEGDPREASADFWIGDGPREYLGGKVPVVQANCQIQDYYCWHAAPSFNTYMEKYPGQHVSNDRRQVIWDGDEFLVPSKGINRRSVGIEVEYYGYLKRQGTVENAQYIWAHRDVTRRLPGGVQNPYADRTAEKLHTMTRQTLYMVSTALCKEYTIPQKNILGHRQVDPLNRSDPLPAYTPEEVAEAVRQALTPAPVPPPAK